MTGATGSGTQTETPVRRLVAHVMGMPISLAVRGPRVVDHGDEIERAWAAAIADLQQADEVFSTYREDSWISRLGRGEVRLADCPADVHEVYLLGERARLESGGAFSIRMSAEGGMRLDPSGIVKGWATSRAAERLRRLADTDFCLSAGGDMVCHVDAAERPAWQIGIEDPHDPDRLVAVVPIRSGAIATSANTHRGVHILDARTGLAPVGVASVTVIAEDLTGADIDATAAFAQGPEALSWLKRRTGRAGLVVWADGRAEVFGQEAVSRSV